MHKCFLVNLDVIEVFFFASQFNNSILFLLWFTGNEKLLYYFKHDMKIIFKNPNKLICRKGNLLAT